MGPFDHFSIFDDYEKSSWNNKTNCNNNILGVKVGKKEIEINILQFAEFVDGTLFVCDIILTFCIFLIFLLRIFLFFLL